MTSSRQSGQVTAKAASRKPMSALPKPRQAIFVIMVTMKLTRFPPHLPYVALEVLLKQFDSTEVTSRMAQTRHLIPKGIIVSAISVT